MKSLNLIKQSKIKESWLLTAIQLNKQISIWPVILKFKRMSKKISHRIFKEEKTFNHIQMRIIKILSNKMTKIITVNMLFQKKILNMNLAKKWPIKKKKKSLLASFQNIIHKFEIILKLFLHKILIMVLKSITKNQNASTEFLKITEFPRKILLRLKKVLPVNLKISLKKKIRK